MVPTAGSPILPSSSLTARGSGSDRSPNIARRLGAVNYVTLYGIAAIPVLVWIYLLTGRGGFWRVEAHRASGLPQADARRVVVLIPARNEGAVIGTAVTSLARQAFNGPVHIIVIDDGSSD